MATFGQLCKSAWKESSSSVLKRTEVILGQSIGLSFSWPRAIYKTTLFTISSNALRIISWKYFQTKSLGRQFPKFQLCWILWIWSDFFRMNENFIQKMLPCLLAWMAKVAWLSNRAVKNALFTSQRSEYSVINRVFPPIKMFHSYIHLWKLD